MPIQYTPSKHAYYCDPETLTEQEHKNDCDINVIIKRAHNGHMVNMSNRSPVYGFDDINLDGLKHRILKQETKEELEELITSQEFDAKDVEILTKNLPESLVKRLKIKKQEEVNQKTELNKKDEVKNERHDSSNSTKPS